MYYIYIFDYSSGNIFEIKVTEEMSKNYSDTEEIIAEYCDLSNIHYMITEEQLDIININK